MTFAQPQFLYFLGFGLLPIFLYLFNFQRVKKVEFTQVALIKEISQTVHKRFQLKRLLVMLARLLAIISLVMAFAQPSFKTLETHPQTHHVIFLDNSLSMSAKVQDVRLLDKAKIILNKTVDSRNGDLFTLLDHSNLAVERDFFSEKDLMKEVAQVEITNATWESSDILSLMRKKKSMLPKKYYYISDFQASTSDVNSFKTMVLEKSSTLELCQLEVEIDNAWIDSLWLENSYLEAGNQCKLNFVALKKGVKKEYLLKCLVDGVQTGAKTLNFSGDQLVESIDIQIPKAGFNQISLQINDEKVEFDNQFFATLEANKKIKILLVKGQQNDFFESAYKNEDLFQVESVSESQLNTSQLVEANLLVLSGLKNLNQLPLQQVRDFIKNGGSVFIVPEKNQKSNSLKDFIQNIQVSISVSDILESKEEELDYRLLKTHPWFLKNIQSLTEGKMLNVKYLPKFEVTGGIKFLKSLKGIPFIAQFKNGNGQLYLLNTSLDDTETNFSRHAFFVITSYEMAMSSAAVNQNPYFVIKNDEIRLPSLDLISSQNYTFANSLSQFKPIQSFLNKDLIIGLEGNEKAGNYKILDGTKKSVSAVSLNLNHKESLFEQLDLSELDKIDNIELKTWDALKTQVAEEEKIGFGVWKWWVIAALLFLLSETILIRLKL